MKTRSRKSKGRRLQVKVAKDIAEVIDAVYGKDQDVSSRGMGQSGTDVVLSREALERFPFSVECKNQETWRLKEWIAQAKQNTLPGTSWLLVVKSNRQSPIVIMEWSVFLDLVRKGYRSEIDNCR